jgi:hypothetical protein
LQQLAHGQVKAMEYSCYDINGYHFWMAKLEVSCPLADTTNIRVVTSAADASSHVIDYYGILKKFIEHTNRGTKELTIVFFYCCWLHPIFGIRVDNFSMVEVNHNSDISGTNIILAHQAQ